MNRTIEVIQTGPLFFYENRLAMMIAKPDRIYAKTDSGFFHHDHNPKTYRKNAIAVHFNI